MRYEIKGEPLPVVVCKLEEGEKMITERGSMSWMSPNMKMETSGGGSIGKAFGRLISGEAIFQNIYTAQGGPGLIAFASSFPGSIRTIEISPGNDFIVQKTGFLASESGVELSVFFRKKLGSGFFGGEGFIMQKWTGPGKAFLELDGEVVKKQLAAGETLKVDSGYVAAMTENVSLDITMVKGVKNIVFGGEGLFLTTLTGPGTVWLQTMPISKLAGSIYPYLSIPN